MRPAEGDPKKAEKKTTGRVFSSSYTTPGLSFAAALSKQPEKSQQTQTYQIAVPTETTVVQRKVSATSQQKDTGQSIQAPNVNSDPLAMVRALTVVEQIMSGLKDDVSKEAKFVAIAEFVFKLMK
jgi:hypothetical protein